MKLSLKYTVFLSILSLFILSACEKQELPDVTKYKYQLKADTIATDIGKYGPFDVGSFWAYEGIITEQNDIEQETDTTKYRYRIDASNDTIVGNRLFIVYDQYLYYTKNGEYYRENMSDEVNEFHLEKYLDTEKEVGESWKDSVQVLRGNNIEFQLTTYTIKEKQEDQITVREKQRNQLLPTFYTYKKGIGLVNIEEVRVFGHKSVKLINSHIEK